jgi:hypothetical protein
MFQLAITFHGGMRAIAYEWGDNGHPAPSKVGGGKETCVKGDGVVGVVVGVVVGGVVST